jgi:hypothetical protein
VSPFACTLFDQAEAFGASQRFGLERVEPPPLCKIRRSVRVEVTPRRDCR